MASPVYEAARYTASGFYGSIHIFHILNTLTGGDIDPTSIEDAYEKISTGVYEREWYDILQFLTSARILSFKDDGKLEVFSAAFDAAMEAFPQIVNGTVDEEKNMLACSHSLGWKEVAKVRDILKPSCELQDIPPELSNP